MTGPAGTDVSVTERQIVLDILAAHLPAETRVWVFGSRATGRARRYSDLDLAIDAGRPLSLDETALLREAFTDSDLVYKVDVVDWHGIDEPFQKEIAKELGLEVEVSEVYRRIFFTEAKKRYAGLRADDSLDIVGLEVIRGDWAQLAKSVQENVLGIILREQSVKKAVDYVHKVVTELKQRKVPFRDLIIWKTLTKPPEQYAVRAPHVEAAKMLMEKGWHLTGGDKVGFVILAGKGRFYSRVKPYVFATYDEVDVDYYVTNQVVPAAARVLEFFGVTEKELETGEKKEAKDAKSLMDYV